MKFVCFLVVKFVCFNFFQGGGKSGEICLFLNLFVCFF